MAAAQLLVPDDILACVLRHLATGSLATSRSVCKRWHAIIDDRRLLRADLLPLSLHRIFFMEQINSTPPKFFESPLIERKIAVNLITWTWTLPVICISRITSNGLL
ncbi:hypothetical protein ZWY2020_027315 [Hordeum vulgare]|nr:hypothetical protein ZWY2020_027315 [Hordeum vulgare]